METRPTGGARRTTGGGHPVQDPSVRVGGGERSGSISFEIVWLFGRVSISRRRWLVRTVGYCYGLPHNDEKVEVDAGDRRRPVAGDPWFCCPCRESRRALPGL